MSVIAISRGSLYAAKKLAEGLKERLGYRVITREEVIDAAKRYGIEETGLGEKDIMKSHPPGYWHERSDQRLHYLTCFKTALLDFAMKDPIVYHGNLAHVLLNEVPCVLRIRINAPLENRVSQLMEGEGISREEAIENIKEMDRSRRQWTQFLYDAEVFDPIFFDLVLNLDRVSIEDAIDLVVSESQKEPFQSTENSTKILRDLHLSSLVKMNFYLLPPEKIKAQDLDVDVDSSTGKVVISGNVPADELQDIKAEIENALSGVESIKEVNLDINPA